MNRFVIRQSALLLLTAAIWGVAFVAQSVGMEYIGPFTFNAARNFIGALVLLPYIAVQSRYAGRRGGAVMQPGAEQRPETAGQPGQEAGTVWWKNRTLLAGGISCGVLLFVAGNLQQIGIQYTTVGKAGFITAMYIVLVPVLGIFMKQMAGLRVWIAVAIAVAGLYLLCMTGQGFSVQKGDLYVLACALAFSFHILTIDYFTVRVDGVWMACIQFFVCALLSGVCMLAFEKPQPGQLLLAWMPLLYAGALSCGVAYTLQIVGQRGMDPTVASLILSLESVISVIAGWLILGQELTVRERLGCVLMFAAIVLVQLPGKRRGE